MTTDLDVRRFKIRREMDRLADKIMASLTNENTADDHDAREELWMKRENLRAELGALT